MIFSQENRNHWISFPAVSNLISSDHPISLVVMMRSATMVPGAATTPGAAAMMMMVMMLNHDHGRMRCVTVVVCGRCAGVRVDASYRNQQHGQCTERKSALHLRPPTEGNPLAQTVSRTPQ